MLVGPKHSFQVCVRGGRRLEVLQLADGATVEWSFRTCGLQGRGVYLDAGKSEVDVDCSIVGLRVSSRVELMEEGIQTRNDTGTV